MEKLQDKPLIDRIRITMKEYPREDGYSADDMLKKLKEHNLVNEFVTVIDVYDVMKEFYG